MERRDGRPTSKEQGRGQKESRERQQVPNVWNYLERRVTLKDHPRGLEFDKEKEELERLEDKLCEEGTVRDRLIFDLYDEIRYDPGSLRSAARFRRLSREEFREFRSQVEPLSDKELAKKLHKQEEVNYRLAAESRRNSLSTSVRFLPALPPDDDIDD